MDRDAAFGHSPAPLHGWNGSIEKQIEAHAAWIEKPTLKVKDCAGRSDSCRQAVLKRWRDDISRQREQVEVLQGILRERAHGTE